MTARITLLHNDSLWLSLFRVQVWSWDKAYSGEERRDSMLLMRVRNARVSRTTLRTAGDSW